MALRGHRFALATPERRSQLPSPARHEPGEGPGVRGQWSTNDRSLSQLSPVKLQAMERTSVAPALNWSMNRMRFTEPVTDPPYGFPNDCAAEFADSVE